MNPTTLSSMPTCAMIVGEDGQPIPLDEFLTAAEARAADVEVRDPGESA